MHQSKEVSSRDLVTITKDWFSYFVSRWLVIASIAIAGAIIGLLYAWFQKPLYTAEITFATEMDSKSSLGSYAGIAAQFGFDIGGGSGGAFEGENLIHFMRSTLMTEKSLLTNITVDGKKQLMIDYYLASHEISKGWEKDARYKDITFINFDQSRSRVRDSIFKKVSKDISTALTIDKVEKKADIISVKFIDNNEVFAKLYTEILVKNVIDYYIDYKSQKSKQNVKLLQRQTDSVKSLLTGNITDIAATNDLNVNPMRQLPRAGVQRKQVDMQVNGALYTELVKNLELSKISLRRETPFIQLIDTPMLPLEKKKMGRLKGAVYFAFAFGFLAIIYLAIKRFFTNNYATAV